jgi:hypothetical protein
MWLLFNKFKQKAIIYDQYKSTHKIRDEVNDTSHAEVVFDEITYYKGAAILKYYYYVAGNELFFKGLKNYLSKYHNKNANYEQFKEILQNLSVVRDIKTPLSIIEPFLDNTGVTRLETKIVYSLNQIAEFYIVQNTCAHGTVDKYYNHMMNILFIYGGSGTEQIFNEIEISDSHLNRIEKFEKMEKPSAIVLNAGDWGYFKQTFDETSRDYLIENTYKIKDSVTRLIVARDFSEMIKDSHCDVDSYIQFAINLLKHERESFIVEQVIRTAIYTATHYVIFEKQDKYKETIFDLIREELFSKHKEIRKSLINFMIDLIDFSNNKQIKYLINFLSNDDTKTNLLRGNSEILDNINMIHSFDLTYVDEDTKFRLLETIEESHVLTADEKKQFEEIIIAIEVVSSRSISRANSGIDLRIKEPTPNLLTYQKLEKLTLDACAPNLANKEKLWSIFVYKEANWLDEEYEASMRGFGRRSQYKLLRDFYENRFFSDFVYVKNYWGEKYAEMFFKYLSPSFIVNDKILRSFIDLARELRYGEYKLKKRIEESKLFIY